MYKEVEDFIKNKEVEKFVEWTSTHTIEKEDWNRFLCVAAYTGCVEAVEICLKNGADDVELAQLNAEKTGQQLKITIPKK